MKTKRCPRCEIKKPLSEWGKTSKVRKSDGVRVPVFQWCCKSCYREYARERKEYGRNNYLIRKYGITQDDYLKMVADQGGRCAICGSESDKSFHIDHCHETGKVRGLLCGPCNHAIGLMYDDPETLRAAAEYLEAGGE